MNLKKNQVLFGIILLLIGLFALIQNFFGTGFGLGNITLMIAGGAFLLLYRTKRVSWALMLGVSFAYIGAARSVPLLSALTNNAAMFFIIPAIIFLVLCFDKNKKGLLLPGMILLWFGIFIIINGLPLAGSMPFSPLPLCIGAAFIMTYFLGRGYVKKSRLYIGVILFIIGGIPDLGPLLRLALNFPAALAGLFIIIGAVVIIKAVIKKGR